MCAAELSQNLPMRCNVLDPDALSYAQGVKHEAMGKEGRALGSRLATTPGRFAAECRGTDAKMISRTVQPGAEREEGWAGDTRRRHCCPQLQPGVGMRGQRKGSATADGCMSPKWGCEGHFRSPADGQVVKDPRVESRSSRSSPRPAMSPILSDGDLGRGTRQPSPQKRQKKYACPRLPRRRDQCSLWVQRPTVQSGNLPSGRPHLFTCRFSCPSLAAPD